MMILPDPEDDLKQRTMVDRLKIAGFRRVGAFASKEGAVAYVLREPPADRSLLYAFVLDRSMVAFIGRTCNGLLADLHSHFSNGPAVSGGCQCGWLIELALDSGQEVDIYALPESGHLMLRGFVVNIAAGIEENMVHVMQPPWNMLLSNRDDDHFEESLLDPEGWKGLPES